LEQQNKYARASTILLHNIKIRSFQISAKSHGNIAVKYSRTGTCTAASSTGKLPKNQQQ
jgi:hypothetical protein